LRKISLLPVTTAPFETITELPTAGLTLVVPLNVCSPMKVTSPELVNVTLPVVADRVPPLAALPSIVSPVKDDTPRLAALMANVLLRTGVKKLTLLMVVMLAVVVIDVVLTAVSP